MTGEYYAINVMLPTRGRAGDRLPRFLNSLAWSTSDPSAVCVSLLVDDDDIATIDYLTGLLPTYPLNMHLHLNHDKKGVHLSRFFNRLYALGEGMGEGVLVSMFGDDMEFLTPGWEQAFLHAANAADGWALVYGDDCYKQHEAMAVHFATSRKLVRATGESFMWEAWRANIIDWVWTVLAAECGLLRYLPGVRIAHRHSSAFGADETYHGMDAHRVFVAGREHVLRDYVAQMAPRVRKAMQDERSSILSLG